MNLRELINQADRFIRNNSPTILTALGVSGTVSTAYLAGRASFRAAQRIQNEPQSSTKTEKLKLVWTLYIPSAISGTMTIACIVFAAKVNNRRTAAITAAYSLSERALIEYKDKVIETIGERKEQKVRDDIAQDKVRTNPPSSALILEGSGGVLVCELFTGRYFKSDMEALKKARNELNSRLLNHSYATMSDFYYLLGWPQTSESSNMGWNDDRLMEMDFSTVFGPNDVPCIAFEYNYTKPL